MNRDAVLDGCCAHCGSENSLEHYGKTTRCRECRSLFGVGRGVVPCPSEIEVAKAELKALHMEQRRNE